MASTRATGGRQQQPLSAGDPVAARKRAAAVAAAALVEDGMRLGLGTGTTVAFLLPALAERGLTELRCAATSPATAIAARALGLRVESLDHLAELDLAIDGADQVADDGWLVKGGGGAHTREKIVAAAAARFIVIAGAEKAVSRIAPPIPLELLAFGVQHTLAALAPARLRAAPASPDGGLIADYHGPVGEPRELAARLSATPGVVDHGLFAPEMVSLVLLADDERVHERVGARRSP